MIELIKALQQKSLIQKLALMVVISAIIATIIAAIDCEITKAKNRVNTSRTIIEARITPVNQTPVVEPPEVEPETPQAQEPKPEPVEAQQPDPAAYIAKTIYGEARGLGATEQAAVAWCILNRVDAYGSDIISVVTAPSQFHGYSASNPVTDDIYNLVLDVIERWELEKTGVENVGRVLPKEYLFFYGSGGHNHFRTGWRSGDIYDWRLESPYDN